jgi:hypothetical protein
VDLGPKLKVASETPNTITQNNSLHALDAQDRFVHDRLRHSVNHFMQFDRETKQLHVLAAFGNASAKQISSNELHAPPRGTPTLGVPLRFVAGAKWSVDEVCRFKQVGRCQR